MDHVISILIIILFFECYYRFRVWLSSKSWGWGTYKYKWTCPNCSMFSASATDLDIIERVKAAHTCGATPV